MTGSRIMIVEDERITAEDLREVLAERGYEVTAVVSTGAEAVEQAERGLPDLAIMDIRLKGGMDGIEAAQILRNRFNIPVIYLTAHTDADSLKRARLAEPLGYLVKPFQESELEASIEMALHKHRKDVEAIERERQLSATLSALGEGLICADAGGKITYLNPAAERWTGIAAAEAQGRPIDKVLPVASVEAALGPALHKGTIEEFEGVMAARADAPTRVDNQERRVAGSIAPIRDAAGGIAGAAVIFGDVRRADSGMRGAPASGAEADEDEMLREAGIVAVSEPMRRLARFARRVAASEVTTILLSGESGTGKDVLVQFMHDSSRRAGAPFVAINCAAIPETLLESELFGYEKGAFTDARAQKKGIIETGDKGTVFLDEIGEMPPALQAKLLRVLEQQTFRRLGGVRDIQVDVRVVAATNRSLRDAVRTGQFRTDLYYRLNVISMTVPALRERREDVLPLARHFVRLYNEKFGLDVKGLSQAAERTLEEHDWPGNVRELRNAVERAMVLEETPWIQPASLSLEVDEPSAAGSKADAGAALDGLSLEEAEIRLLTRALEKTHGNQSRAARLLGISRDAMRYKIKKFNLHAVGLSES